MYEIGNYPEINQNEKTKKKLEKYWENWPIKVLNIWNT
jgi:hypothetical protein